MPSNRVMPQRFSTYLKRYLGKGCKLVDQNVYNEVLGKEVFLGCLAVVQGGYDLHAERDRDTHTLWQDGIRIHSIQCSWFVTKHERGTVIRDIYLHEFSEERVMVYKASWYTWMELGIIGSNGSGVQVYLHPEHMELVSEKRRSLSKERKESIKNEWALRECAERSGMTVRSL